MLNPDRFRYTYPLTSRRDLAEMTRRLVEPSIAHFTPTGTGIVPAPHGQHYTAIGASLEGLARPLWAIAPLMAGGESFAHWSLWTSAIEAGLDPNHPGYWGDVPDGDQRFVEHASISTALLLMRERFTASVQPQTLVRLQRWLGNINGKQLPDNNWRFFRVLANLALPLVGGVADESQLKLDLDRLDEFYLGDGWYSDGATDQRDHYIAFAIHYYGLLYSVVAQHRDPGRSQLYRDRATQFARDYARWFAADGSAIAYGRSLTYRFAHAAFWGALAYANVEALPWSQVKGLFMRNLRWWSQQPMLAGDGTLPVGYAYPNLIMAETYNGPGCAYWALKAMLPLALAEDHPFWSASESPLALDESVHAIPHAHQLTRHDADGHVVVLSGGQYIGWGLRHWPEKYAKFSYSTRAGFAVSCGDDRAHDNTLAVSDNGGAHWAVRRSVTSRAVSADSIVTTSEYLRGIQITTTLRFAEPLAHVREHRIRTDRAIEIVEGGFPVAVDDPYLSAQQLASSQAGAAARVGNQTTFSSIRAVEADSTRQAEISGDQVNLNLLFPRSVHPLLRATLTAGEHRLITHVAGGPVPAC
jgi:hypothetical protein